MVPSNNISSACTFNVKMCDRDSNPTVTLNWKPYFSRCRKHGAPRALVLGTSICTACIYKKCFLRVKNVFRDGKFEQQQKNLICCWTTSHHDFTGLDKTSVSQYSVVIVEPQLRKTLLILLHFTDFPTSAALWLVFVLYSWWHEAAMNPLCCLPFLPQPCYACA